jgi:hypothetical protein
MDKQKTSGKNTSDKKIPGKKTLDWKTSGKKKTVGNTVTQPKGAVKSEKVQQKEKVQMITDWFYMSAADVNAKEISDLLKVNGYNQIELWEEMNVLQIETNGHKSIDFEPVTYQWKDSADAAFIKNHNIKTIFAVTVEELESFQPVIKLILNKWGGFFCADSPDFKPSYDAGDL